MKLKTRIKVTVFFLVVLVVVLNTGSMSHLPLMDREIYGILNRDYDEAYEDKVRRFYLYCNMDTNDGKLYAEKFYKIEDKKTFSYNKLYEELNVLLQEKRRE